MSLLGGAAALALALVLLAAAIGHLRDPQGLRAALIAHGLLPRGMRSAVAAVLAPVELLLGAGLLLGVVAGVGLTRLPALAATLLLGGFTAYLFLVRRTQGAAQVPCGCGLGSTPLGPWSVVRAALLTGLGVLAVVGGVPAWVDAQGLAAVTGSAPEAPVWAQALVLAAAGLSLAVTTAALPAARAVPPAQTTLHGGAR